MNTKVIKKGSALVAQPFMADNNFNRTVLIICEHNNEDGTVGFVINRKSPFMIQELLEDFPEFEVEVYYGGPVAPETLHYIHNVGDLLEGSIEIKPGIFWGGDFEKLKFLIGSDLILPKNIKFFLGYSGWDPGQLEGEFVKGSWILDEMFPNYLFKSDSELLWKQILTNKGNTFSVIAQMPNSTRVN